MRFPRPSRGWVVVALLCLPSASLASAEAVKKELTARLQQQLPGIAAADYALGAAAFDTDLRSAREVPAENMAAVLESGKALWNRKFRNGRTLAGCFPNGGRRVAAAYPQYDPRLKRVVTLEMAINQCLKTHNEPLLDHGDAPTMGAVTAYVRSLSNGQKLAVRVPAAAEDRFEEGRRLYFTRMGQRNYACASCHVQSAGKRFGDTPLSPALGQATHWPVIRESSAITLQSRIRECLELMGVAPFPAGSEELNAIEYFLSYLSNGMVLKANVKREATANK